MDLDLSTNTDALIQRAYFNASGEQYNLEQWIITFIQPIKDLNVLDLGCGTGKQLFALGDLVLPGGSILGIDISNDAVNEIKNQAKIRKLSHVTAIQGNFDDCVALLKPRKFDRIVSSYAIYYSKNLVNLLSDLKNILVPNGEIFICGFGSDTNKELITLINCWTNETGVHVDPIEDFFSEEALQKISGLFSRIYVKRLNNFVFFKSTTDFMSWWKNHSSYNRLLHHLVEKQIDDHIKHEGSFVLTKNVLGVHIYV